MSDELQQEKIYLPPLRYFENKNTFSGSCGMLLYAEAGHGKWDDSCPDLAWPVLSAEKHCGRRIGFHSVGRGKGSAPCMPD